MDQFIDWQYVSLQSSTSGMYLHADEDWRGVSSSMNPRPINAIWRVQRVLTPNGPVMLLQSAAFGRYLGATATLVEKEASSDRYRRRAYLTEQRDFNDPADTTIRWVAESTRIVDIETRIRPRVIILSVPGRFLLQSDNTGSIPRTITYDWTVQPVPPSFTNRLMSWYWRAPQPLLGQLQKVEGEGSRYVRMLFRRFIDDNWVEFRFAGRSLSNLRNLVAPYIREGELYKMFIKAGLRARTVRLVVDLPISTDPITIIVTIHIAPGMIAKNISETGQQVQQNKPDTGNDPGSSQFAATPVSGRESVDIKIEAATSTEEAQQKKPCTVTNNVGSDPGSSQFTVTPVSGHRSIDIKIEPVSSPYTSDDPAVSNQAPDVAEKDQLDRPKRVSKPPARYAGEEWMM